MKIAIRIVRPQFADSLQSRSVPGVFELTEARKIDVKKFAREHYRALVRMPTRYNQPPLIAALYLGPDSWAESDPIA